MKNWLKNVGKTLQDAAAAKIDDAKQRASEPPLNAEEATAYQEFLRLRAYAPTDILQSIPKCPDSETMWSRRDIRTVLYHPNFTTVAAAATKGYADYRASIEEQNAAANRIREIENAKKFSEIEAFYANEVQTIELALNSCIPHIISESAITAMGHSVATKSSGFTINDVGKNPFIAGPFYKAGRNALDAAVRHAVIRRSLQEIEDADRARLRLADVLVVLGMLSTVDLQRIRGALLLNDGKAAPTIPDGTIDGKHFVHCLEGVTTLCKSSFGSVAGATEQLASILRSSMESTSNLLPSEREVLERFISSGNRWMMSNEGRKALCSDALSPSALRLGGFTDSNTDLLYDMRESLITIAPPGAGKSQAQVLRNLLYIESPAVVLDIKGEMLAASRGWRESVVGPCYWFAPATPDKSYRFNPLDTVRSDIEVAWDDARRLADLLVVPNSKTGDDYFEGRARDLITTSILDVAISENGHLRSMSSVLDRLYLSEDEKLIEWFSHLESLGVPQLRRQASALRGMPVKQREGILDSARRQLEIWQSPAIERLSSTSDFTPEVLRRDNATLYLYVTLEDVKKYASILRVIIGQTVAELCRTTPEAGAQPVTFFLDELPRLGHMDVIEQALDVGRGYGVRLWMFCQNLGQLSTAYPNAEGMVSNCAVRCFMNPDEKAAKWISENLGARQGLLDGRRKPLAEPAQLTGPEFANQIVVFSRGNPPARLEKRPAYSDPECQRRIGNKG